MSLDESFRSAVLRDLSEHLNIFETRILLHPNQFVLIKRMLDHGDLSLDELRAAVHDGLLRCGHEMYWQHIKLRIFPDHLDSPQALGYAIQHGRITESEARRIRFDHHETLEEYRAYADGLLECVLEQIANKLPTVVSAGGCFGNFDDDECFECH